jgi:hypothetical protein
MKARRSNAAERAAPKLPAEAPAPPVDVRREASKARYEASPKGRAAAARYAASEKGRARAARYNRSEKGRARSISHNRTAKGRARRARFEATQHRREYKALAYVFGSPYRDLMLTAVLSMNRALPSWGAEALTGLQFKRVPTRCPHCVAQGRKNLLPMGSRLIPIHRATGAR